MIVDGLSRLNATTYPRCRPRPLAARYYRPQQAGVIACAGVADAIARPRSSRQAPDVRRRRAVSGIVTTDQSTANTSACRTGIIDPTAARPNGQYGSRSPSSFLCKVDSRTVTKGACVPNSLARNRQPHQGVAA